jgi:tRNA(His) guanylyltransferase
LFERPALPPGNVLPIMANSEYGYVRNFEQDDSLPPSNWIVLRIDGRGFSKLTKKYGFTKPNDLAALDLINAAALEVVKSMVDVVIAYGQSDEYSFVLHESTTLFDRRAAKLATTVATNFTAEYCMQWPKFFPDKPLERPYPTFDGRCVCYPKRKILRDYLAWRQADCHINNLYNTTFWKLVQRGVSQTEAELQLKGTLSGDKNEILFKQFGINYNNEPPVCRKGSVIYRAYGNPSTGHHQNGVSSATSCSKAADSMSKTQIEKQRKQKQKAEIVVEHVDIIGDAFWDARPYLLASRRGGTGDE